MKISRIFACHAAAAIFLLWCNPHANAVSTEPILRMELGKHHASIFDIAMDPTNRILVTGSEDKTVRVWEISQDIRLLRTMRPPIGEGEVGQIFAVALSPDGSTVACGGRTGEAKQKDGCVYLFNHKSGELTRRLDGLPGWAQDLVYTADGRFLAVLMSERGGRSDWTGLRLFRLPDYALVAEDRGYGNYTPAIAGDPSGSKLATSCFDGFIRLYDLSALNPFDIESPVPIAPVSKIIPLGGYFPWGLAFAPDGRHLAVGFHMTPKVEVLEVKGHTLTQAHTPNTKGIKANKEVDFRNVAWTPDGRFLFGGGGYRVGRDRRIRKWDNGGQGRSTDLSLGVDFPIQCMLSLSTGGIVWASRDGSIGMIDQHDRAVLLSPKVIPVYTANAEGLLLSPEGTVVQFAFERGGKSPALFNVNERQLIDDSSYLWSDFKSAGTLHAPVTRSLEISDWETSLTARLRGQPLKLNQEVSKSLAITPDASGFLLGSTIALWHFDASGTRLWRIRMPGAVWALNTNGQVAVAALGDGTIRWYRLADGGELLALFPHPDRRRWILWTPTGYYDASPGGEGFIGWHINNGPDQAADFFPISRFRATRFRPDVIDRVLVTLDEQEALRQAGKASGRRLPSTPIQESLPPVTAIVSPADGAEIADTSITIRYAIRSREPVTALKVLIDGRPIVDGRMETPIQQNGEIAVTLPQRDCQVALIGQNRSGAGEPATIRLRWKGAAQASSFEIKPNLYVLAIGVSSYQDADLRLDLAAKDAADFAATWNGQKAKLYRNVEVRTLTDDQATKGNILDGLEWLQRQVTSKDVAMLFFAGHGINDAIGGFYFLPVDGDLEKLKRTGISQFDITATVAGIAGKVIVFMDACHSGNLMGKLKHRGVVLVSAVVNELTSAENGAVVFSSASGRQYAFENKDWENGAFTKGVLEGLQGKADYNATGRITLNMLDLYVSERVKELTRGQQTPTTAKPPNMPDFPVAMLR